MSHLPYITDLTNRLPTTDEITSAAEAATAFTITSMESGCLGIKSPQGETITLAPAVANLIVDLLGYIAKGNMVTLVPTGAMLTTQQAADILNVSRPFLSKLLKEGEIPFVPVGSHRRVHFADLMAYKTKRDATRTVALKELSRLGQTFDAS